MIVRYVDSKFDVDSQLRVKPLKPSLSIVLSQKENCPSKFSALNSHFAKSISETRSTARPDSRTQESTLYSTFAAPGLQPPEHEYQQQRRYKHDGPCLSIILAPSETSPGTWSSISENPGYSNRSHAVNEIGAHVKTVFNNQTTTRMQTFLTYNLR